MYITNFKFSGCGSAAQHTQSRFVVFCVMLWVLKNSRSRARADASKAQNKISRPSPSVRLRAPAPRSLRRSVGQALGGETVPPQSALALALSLFIFASLSLSSLTAETLLLVKNALAFSRPKKEEGELLSICRSS